MGTIQIKKYERTVTVGKKNEQRQQVQKTYGKIIYRGTLSLNDMAEHIMKHGSVYTEDVVIGVITKLKTCLQEMLADGYKVKLDGIGTLYPVCSSEGVADAKDYSASENVTRVGIAFLADQSRKSMYKARSMRDAVSLSTKLYSELTGEEGLTPTPSPSGEGSSNTGNGNTGGGNQGGNGGGGDEPGGDGNDQN
jgi:predicted histone-like DNA-binding protein